MFVRSVGRLHLSLPLIGMLLATLVKAHAGRILGVQMHTVRQAILQSEAILQREHQRKVRHQEATETEKEVSRRDGHRRIRRNSVDTVHGT